MEIGVYFVGVCTHVQWGKTRPAFLNRVVLVNGSGHPRVRDKDIPSHVAALHIAADDVLGTESIVLPEPVGGIITLPLNGVRMRIANTIGEINPPDGSVGTCIPSLDQLTPGLGRPSKEAVEDGKPELTSCIFDVTGGRLQGGSNGNGAAFGFLSAETDGTPRLRITPFGSETWGEIQLRDHAQITLSNLGENETDDEWDFYLHYKLAETMPLGDLGRPGRSPCADHNTQSASTWPPGFKSVGPGCSNSAYP